MTLDPAAWLAAGTRSDSADLPEALQRKGSHTISLVLPARNEAATVGPLVAALVSTLQRAHPLVDELLVLDDGSTDDTAALSREAGARVLAGADVHPEVPRGGKGTALWKGLTATTGDLVVFLDADVPSFPPHWVASLLLPLLRDPGTELVKAAYDRPLSVDGVAHPGSGGRVTRLTATPLLGALHPELVVVAQPLAGETAARRSLLESLSFTTGYGVELGLLLDAHARLGLRGLAQVDLGERTHRHHPDAEIAAMAAAVVQVALRRSGVPLPEGQRHRRVVRNADGRLILADDALDLRSLPPLRDVKA